jgi:hypothetical protein
MKRSAQCLLVAAVIISASVFCPLFAESAIEVSRRHLKIGLVADMSYGKPYGPPDENFWDIVRLGKAALPDLLILVEDDTVTELHVNYFGGVYQIGDIAVIAMMAICPDLPVVKFVDDPQQPRFETIGFGVYWAYVRESHDNRRRLQAKLRDWFAENESRLQWFAKPEHPAGGWYALGPLSEE